MEREGEAWFVAVSIGALPPPSLPAGSLFLGQGCLQKQQGFSPHFPQQAERWRADGEGEESSGRRLSVLQDAQRFVSSLLEDHTDPPTPPPPAYRLPLLLLLNVMWSPSTGRQRDEVPLSAQLLLPESKAPRSLL